MAAYDGARAAALLWRAGEVHVIADYALLRVVTEAAVLAWWITAEPDPDIRAFRAYRIVLDDLSYALARERSAVRDAVTEPARSKRKLALDGVEREARRIAADMEGALPIASEKQRTPQALKLGSLLVEAQRQIPGASDLGYSLLWSIASTTAHGSLSAVEQMASFAVPGVAGTHPENVATFAVEAAHLLHAAHESWNRYVGR